MFPGYHSIYPLSHKQPAGRTSQRYDAVIQEYQNTNPRNNVIAKFDNVANDHIRVCVDVVVHTAL